MPCITSAPSCSAPLTAFEDRHTHHVLAGVQLHVCCGVSRLLLGYDCSKKAIIMMVTLT